MINIYKINNLLLFMKEWKNFEIGLEHLWTKNFSSIKQIIMPLSHRILIS